MSTKINCRSPYFLNLTAPSEGLQTFICEEANSSRAANPFGFAVASDGTITLPSLQRGTIIDQSVAKFAALSSSDSATSRTLTLTIQIPSGFVNTGTISCDVTATQQPPIATDSKCPSTNGTIPAQTLTVSTGTATINVSSYFSAGTESISSYTLVNNHTAFIDATLSSSTLTLNANDICGTKQLHVQANISSLTCIATQSFNVTINGCGTFDCTEAALQGGEISQDGTTITKPHSGTSVVGNIYAAVTGGSPITSVAANSGANPQNVTLYFELTVGSEYSNPGVFGTRCPATLSQAGTGNPTIVCPDNTSESNPAFLQFSGWRITPSGSTLEGTVSVNGSLVTVTDYTTNFANNTGTSTIARTVTVTMTFPSGSFTNAGASSQTCDITINQEFETNVCGTNEFFISEGKATRGELCDTNLPANDQILGFQSTINALDGTLVCRGGGTFRGADLFYAISTVAQNPVSGPGLQFKIIQINNSGFVTGVFERTCAGAGDDIQF
tara:strand:- start:2226 stop:3728 length:1503 start_codon:yes stop_codon:yes gene_type:complete